MFQALNAFVHNTRKKVFKDEIVLLIKIGQDHPIHKRRRQEHTLNMNQQRKTYNKTQHNKSRINQTNFFIWFIHASSDFFVGHGLNQTFPNIFERSDQGRVELRGSFRNILTKCWEHCSHVIVIYELHPGELGGPMKRSMNGNTQHSPPSACICGWVEDWFNPIDPST